MRDKIHMYIDSIALKKLTPRTQHHYGWVLDNLEKYLREKHFPGEESVDASKVTCGMLLDYAKALDQRGLEISTYNNYIIAIKMFFEWLARIRCIETDPSLVLSCARDKQKKADVSVKEPAYNEDELRLFLADIVRGRGKLTTHRDLAILSLILSSGMRAHEVSCLDIRHLDEIADGYAFSMQKGGAVGKILVNNDACYPVIAEYVGRRTDNPGPDDPLFISQQGVRICPNTLWQAFERRQERLGLRTGIHCFRSYFLTDADRSGGGGAARDLGRHKNIKITSRYIRHSQQDLGGVLQDMRLSGVLKELLSA